MNTHKKLTSITFKRKFELPILFKTLNCSKKFESNFNNIDFIQYNNGESINDDSDSKVFLIRLEDNNLYLFSTNEKKDEDGTFDKKDESEEIPTDKQIECTVIDKCDISLITAPSKSKYPICFYLSNNSIYSIEITNTLIRKQIYESFLNIVSIHANTKYLFLGTDLNCLIRIEIPETESEQEAETEIEQETETEQEQEIEQSENQQETDSESEQKADSEQNIKIKRLFLYNFSREKIIAISTFDDLVCIVTSKSRLIVINQDDLKVMVKVPLPFSVGRDAQIKIGLIKEIYSAAILTDSKIHLVSFKCSSGHSSSYYRYQSWIPGESVISYDIHDDAVVVVKESDCNYENYSGRITRVLVYPLFSRDPQYEWDVTKELDFLCRTDIQPSEKERLVTDKKMHVAAVLGYETEGEINLANLIAATSPRNVFADQDGNLWFTSQNCIYFASPISEEIASFRGLLNFGYDYAFECNENFADREFTNFIYAHMISPSDLGHLFDENVDDISNFVKLQDKSELAEKLNAYLAQRKRDGENPPEMGTIAKNVYDNMSYFDHSRIDHVITHDRNQIDALVSSIADEFIEKNPEESRNITALYKRNLSTLYRYVRYFQNIEQPQLDDFFDNDSAKSFWVSAVICRSYQTMKYFISLLVASFLLKKKVDGSYPKLFIACKLHDDMIRIISSCASVYHIAMNPEVPLEIIKCPMEYDTFQDSLSSQFYLLSQSSQFLLKYIISIDEKYNQVCNAIRGEFNDCFHDSIQTYESIFSNNELLKKLNEVEKLFDKNMLGQIKGKLAEISQFKEHTEKNKAVNESIDKMIYDVDNIIERIFDQIRQDQTVQELAKKTDDILAFSLNMSKADHFLVISRIYLNKGNLDLFFRYLRRYKFTNDDFLHFFAITTLKKIKQMNDDRLVISFINENYKQFMFQLVKENQEKLNVDVEIEKMSFFRTYFNSALKLKEFDLAFSALMGLFSCVKSDSIHIMCVEKLIKAMKSSGCIEKFAKFPFGVNRHKVLKVMSNGSSSALFLASSMYYKIKEYSRCCTVLLKYVNSIDFQDDASIEDLRKAKSALILIISLMKNHNIYLRSAQTLSLHDLYSVKLILNRIETKILDKTIDDQSRIPLSMSYSLSSSSNLYISTDSQSFSTNLPSSKKYNAREAALVLNYAKNVDQDLVHRTTNFFATGRKVSNKELFNFVENCKNEEAIQIFLYEKFDRSFSCFSGIWYHIFFAMNNLQVFFSLFYRPAMKKNNEFQKILGQSSKTNNNTLKVRNKPASNNILSRTFSVSTVQIAAPLTPKNNPEVDLGFLNILNEFIQSKKIQNNVSLYYPIFNLPLNTESTSKLMLFVQICFFESWAFKTERKLLSKGYVYASDNCIISNKILIGCQRGKVSISINSKEIELDEGNKFVAISGRSLSPKITGLHDNTLIFISYRS